MCASSRYRYMLRKFDYLNESQLRCTQTKLAIAAAIVIAVVALVPFVATSQTATTIEPGFGSALVAVHQAESAGATPNEIASLVAQLNKALQLNQNALKLNGPGEAQNRTELISQVDQTLIIVQGQATDLTALASHRSYTNKVLNYVWGIVAAVVGTVLFAFTVSFYWNYRIKRTFQMRITRK
jgi:hypothetical protein